MFHCLFSKLSVTTSDQSGNHVGTAFPSPSWAYVAREGCAPLRQRRNAARPLRGGQSPFHNNSAGTPRGQTLLDPRAMRTYAAEIHP